MGKLAKWRNVEFWHIRSRCRLPQGGIFYWFQSVFPSWPPNPEWCRSLLLVSFDMSCTMPLTSMVGSERNLQLWCLSRLWSSAVVGGKIKGKLNAEHESVSEYLVYFYIINCDVCWAGIRTDTLYYTKQIEPLKSWPDHDFACVSGTHLQPKPRDMNNERKYTCLLGYIRAEPTGCLTVSLRGGRVFTMLSSCLAVREHFFPEIQSEPRGKSPLKATTPQTTHKMENMRPQCRDRVLQFFFFRTN